MEEVRMTSPGTTKVTPAVEQASNPTLGSSKPSFKKALSGSKMGKKPSGSSKKKDKKQKETASADSSTPKQKSFRRIRGFITGESRRERRARKAAARAASGQVGPVPKSEDDEEETVYGVAGVDAESVAKSAKNDKLLDADSKTAEITVDTSKTTPSIQVILLLMDGVTRRFELLQLEFDSTKAIVSDLLKQIPHSVTEEALRKQTYKAVCDRNGTELINSTRLSTFCTGSAEILVAVPEGMLPKEVARLSKPILSDEKVIAMLKSSGIDYTPVEPKNGSSSKSRGGLQVPEAKPKSKKSSRSNKIWVLAAVALLAVVFQVIHVFLSSPLKPNQVLSPGITLHEAGVLSLLPFSESSSLEMGTQGTMTLYGPSKQIEWQIFGGLCPTPEADDSCRNGAVLNDAGDLLIGGKIVTSVHVTGDAPLSPWPFEKAPKLRVVRVRG